MIRQGAGEAIPVPGSGYSHERNVPPNGSDADELVGLGDSRLCKRRGIKQFDNAGPAPEPRAQIRLNCAGRARDIAAERAHAYRATPRGARAKLRSTRVGRPAGHVRVGGMPLVLHCGKSEGRLNDAPAERLGEHCLTRGDLSRGTGGEPGVLTVTSEHGPCDCLHSHPSSRCTSASATKRKSATRAVLAVRPMPSKRPRA